MKEIKQCNQREMGRGWMIRLAAGLCWGAGGSAEAEIFRDLSSKQHRPDEAFQMCSE